MENLGVARRIEGNRALTRSQRSVAESSFDILKNAELHFEVAGETEVDPESGNIKPGKVIVNVIASLSRKSASSRQGTQQAVLVGTNTNRVYLEGYAVNPKFLPDSIKPNATGTIELGVEEPKLRGRFELEPREKDIPLIRNPLGDRISGWMEIAP